ncbi:Spindle and centriole-associated protein 1 [Trichoplax sp. H2]|nr:Spindle and centriole-associated protein 1 [Trichoplax sp. H2]|eukprot:RDD37522.1 Spindle and centriole-associated protein 1 [Trichoplax sp. H2]
MIAGPPRRVAVHEPVQDKKNQEPVATKKKKKRKEWDSTVSDLSVYKLSKEELAKRRQLYQSPNWSTSQRNTFMDESNTSRLSQLTPDGRDTKKAVVMKEILHRNDKLQNLLEESDRAVNVIKDLFGDHPRRFIAFPNVTAAPENQELDHNSDGHLRNSIVVQPEEPPTRLSTLSQSVVNTPAINEAISVADDDLPVNDKETNDTVKDTLLDSIHSTQNYTKKGDKLAENIVNNDRNGDDFAESSLIDDGTKDPINQRGKISSLDELKRVVSEIETEIGNYEEEIGDVISVKSNAQVTGFSGYTAALLNTIRRLVRHLRERDKHLKREIEERNRLSNSVDEQRILINGLTADVLRTQEICKSMQSSFDQYKLESELQITHLQKELYAVLKSREYQCVTNTIERLYETTRKPIDVNVASTAKHDIYSGLAELISGNANGDFSYLPLHEKPDQQLFALADVESDDKVL